MATPELAPDLPDPKPASIADGVERRLDSGVVTLDRIVGWIFTASISLGSLVALTRFSWRTVFRLDDGAVRPALGDGRAHPRVVVAPLARDRAPAYLL